MRDSIHQLQPGETFTPAGARATLILAEGEVLLQAPAVWLAGSVVQPPARRVGAPAAIDAREAAALRALGPARLVVQEAPGLFARLAQAWAGVRGGVSPSTAARPRPAGGPPARAARA